MLKIVSTRVPVEHESTVSIVSKMFQLKSIVPFIIFPSKSVTISKGIKKKKKKKKPRKREIQFDSRDFEKNVSWNRSLETEETSQLDKIGFVTRKLIVVIQTRDQLTFLLFNKFVRTIQKSPGRR